MLNEFQDPIIELEPEVDLEFKVYSFEFAGQKQIDSDNLDDVIEAIKGRNNRIETLLNDGWQLEDKIICPPFVMLIFSREKETPDNE